MNLKFIRDRIPAWLRRHPVLGGAGATLLLVALWFSLRPPKSDNGATSYYEVRRGDFTVSVVEGGTLSAVSEISIRSEVEGTARIIRLVPEGTNVSKGDLLVELDSAQAQDQVNQQEINYERAKFAVEQSKAQLEIQRSATNSDYLAAELKLRFARIDREKYEQGQKLVDFVEASNKVVQAEATYAVNLDTYINSTNLAAKGYETKQKVDGDRLAVLNNLNALIVATNGVWILQKFDMVKLSQKYDTDILQAELELERDVNQNKRKMAQYEADLISQINTLELSKQKLERDQHNLAATKIYAPADGLVVYAANDSHFSSESLIEGGAIVRNRQELIKLPDLSRMKVTVKVHESHVNTISPGLPAYVMLDSMPEQRFAGVVERVAPLPDTQSRWGNPNLKVYNTDIYISETLTNVKPGVSAKAEIIVTNIANALSVPIQAVTIYKGKQVVYVANGNKPEPRLVEVALFNTKFIEIAKGLKEGEHVLLSPPLDSQERDLDGSVLSAEERTKLGATNDLPHVPLPADGPPLVSPARVEPVAASGIPGERPDIARDGQERPGRRRNLDREAMLKQFDKDGDGKLNEEEQAAMRASFSSRPRGADGPEGARPTRNR
jgi:HlyD family secretion protein